MIPDALVQALGGRISRILMIQDAPKGDAVALGKR